MMLFVKASAIHFMALYYLDREILQNLVGKFFLSFANFNTFQCVRVKALRFTNWAKREPNYIAPSNPKYMTLGTFKRNFCNPVSITL